MRLGLSTSPGSAAVLRRGASVPAWTPTSLFASSEPGLWADVSDLSSLSQDTAGTTPVTTVGQPVGRIADKSGRGNHLIAQAGTGSRAVLAQDGGGRYYLQFDGVDDGYITSGMTPANGWECFMAVQRDDADQVVLAYGEIGGDYFLGAVQASGGGSATATVNNAGASVSCLVDGASVSNIRSALDAALTVGAPHVVEYRALDLAAWPEFGVGAYFSTWPLNGRFYGCVLRPTMDTTQRGTLRTWLGAKAGLVL